MNCDLPSQSLGVRTYFIKSFFPSSFIKYTRIIYISIIFVPFWYISKIRKVKTVTRFRWEQLIVTEDKRIYRKRNLDLELSNLQEWSTFLTLELTISQSYKLLKWIKSMTSKDTLKWLLFPLWISMSLLKAEKLYQKGKGDNCRWVKGEPLTLVSEIGHFIRE